MSSIAQEYYQAAEVLYSLLTDAMDTTKIKDNLPTISYDEKSPLVVLEHFECSRTEIDHHSLNLLAVIFTQILNSLSPHNSSYRRNVMIIFPKLS